MGTTRVVAFLDYQNLYESARRAFHDHWEPAKCGHVEPVSLAELLVSRRPPRYESQLQQVRVYRGLPDSSKQPESYGANRAQRSKWETDPRCVVVQRPLRYPRNWPEERAEEKGIDVKIALDVVMGAIREAFDVAIVFSTDTDLKPALEEVLHINEEQPGPFPWVEVAAWKPNNRPAPRLSTEARSVWCHYLNESDYQSVSDREDHVARGRSSQP